MDIPKINLTQNQKKIMILSFAGFFIFLLLWVFLYLPASKEIISLKNDLRSTQQQIEAIESFLSDSGSRDEAIRLLKQKQQYLSNRFPAKEEENLNLITEFARRNNIEIINLQPGIKMEFLDESGRQLVIDGKAAYYLPINLETECFYKELVKYLQELKSSFPGFATAVSVNIKKSGQVTGRVRANIGFNLYLLI